MSAYPYYWIGGSSPNWNDPANWTGGTTTPTPIPGAGDTVAVTVANFAATGQTVAEWRGGVSSRVSGSLSVTGLMGSATFVSGNLGVGTLQGGIAGGTVTARRFDGIMTGGTLVDSYIANFTQYGGTAFLNTVGPLNSNDLNYAVDVESGTLYANGVTLSPPAGLYIEALLVNGGLASVSGAATIAGSLDSMGIGVHGGTLLLGGGITVADSGNVNVAGGLLASGGGFAGVQGGLAVSNGAVLTTPSAALGTSGSFSAGVSGAGSGWTNAGALTLGGGGTAVFSLAAGGDLFVGAGLIAAAAGGAKAVIGDYGGGVRVDGSLSLGVAGSAHLALYAGAALSVGGDFVAGQSTGSASYLKVESATADITGNVTLGQDGTGVLAGLGISTIVVGGSMTLGGGTGSGTFDAGATIHGDLAVANGLVNVVAGPLLAVGGTIEIGGPTRGNGIVLLQPHAVFLAGTGDLTVGGEGRGLLGIYAGATLDATASAITVAESASGSGTITVTGTDARLQAASLAVGGAGTASASPAAFLSIAAGGTVDAGASFEVGADAGGVGQATITDVGSTLTAAAFSIGGYGTGVFAILPGAAVDASGDAAVGEQSTGKGTWSLNGGDASVGGTLSVGDAGNGFALVQLGARLDAGAVEIGNKLGGKGELDVTGATLAGGNVSVGSGGSAKLKISGSQVATSGNVDVAEQVNGAAQTVSVTATSTWSVTGTLTVGAAGIAGATIGGGSVATVVGGVVVGDQSGAAGVLTLSGTATVGTVTTRSEIGFGGALVVGNAGDGTLEVQSGALVAAISGGRGEIDIAVAAGSTGDLAISGASSELSGTLLDVGGDASTDGGSGMLSLGGGILQVATIHVWGGGTVSGNGTLGGTIIDAGMIRASGGTLRLPGAVAGAGTIEVGAGGVLMLGSNIAAATAVVFTGAGETLDLYSGGTIAGAVTAFGRADTIIAPGSITGQTTSAFGTTLDIAGGGTLFLAGTLPATPVLNGDTAYIACFASGTRIMTARGEVAVEHLRKGDLVATATGTAPIVWLGHSCLDCRRHPRPWDVRPVRVAAGAFAPGVPRRDLLLSPDHAVFVDGSLIPVRYLINGATIAQEEVDAVTYWHVELPKHGVLLAEGLPCESFLDTGNRPAFADGGTGGRVEPDAALAVWAARGCAPLVTEGEALLAARRRLFERALTMGHAPEDDPGLHLLADGRVIRPASVGGRRYRFALDRACGSVRLASRAAAPAETRPESGDHRRLGVMVTRLALRQGDARREIPLGMLDGAGWHTVEGEGAWRWTDGDAALPLATAEPLELEVELGAWARPWRRPAPATRARA